MTIHYDEKGKFFTNVVSKEKIPVIIQTTTNKVEGNIHVRLDDRIKDELDSDEPFIAVTEAVIFNLDGSEQFRTELSLVNRDQIIWVIPKEKTA